MADITIIDGGEDGSSEPVVEAEAVAEVSEAAVEIAEIEAERDIRLAEISAETQEAQAEIIAEAVEESDEQWRRNIETQISDLKAELSGGMEAVMEALSTLPQSSSSEASPLETPGEPAPASAEVTPDSPEQGASEPAPEPPKRPKKSRWI